MNARPAGPCVEDSMSSAVIFPAQPENILKGLGKLWTSLGQEEKQRGKPTVLRACAMTLIVATDEPDAGFAASQTISELMHAHPARGIVLAVSGRRGKEPGGTRSGPVLEALRKSPTNLLRANRDHGSSTNLAERWADSRGTDSSRSSGYFLVPA